MQRLSFHSQECSGESVGHPPPVLKAPVVAEPKMAPVVADIIDVDRPVYVHTTERYQEAQVEEEEELPGQASPEPRPSTSCSTKRTILVDGGWVLGQPVYNCCS